MLVKCEDFYSELFLYPGVSISTDIKKKNPYYYTADTNTHIGNIQSSLTLLGFTVNWTHLRPSWRAREGGLFWELKALRLINSPPALFRSSEALCPR